MTVDYTLIDLPYLEDHTQCYARLADLPGFVLLESGDRSRGRYDIVTACPTKRFYCSEYANVDDYLVQLEEALPSYLLPVDLPFQGGLIGYFSYDLGAHRLGIEIPENTSLSPAESCLADFGLYDWAIIVDHQQKKVTLFAANKHSDTVAVVEEVLRRWKQNYSACRHFFLPIYCWNF